MKRQGRLARTLSLVSSSCVTIQAASAFLSGVTGWDDSSTRHDSLIQGLASTRDAGKIVLRNVFRSRCRSSVSVGASRTQGLRQEAARHKLGETTNYAAVRKAVAMNLIPPYDTVVAASLSA